MDCKKGVLVVLSGPSGVGKGSIRCLVMNDRSLNLVYSISMTTRQPRNGEVDGKDYYFVTKERFEEELKSGGLLEHATFVGNSYGTPKKSIDTYLNNGRNVFLEIEVNGAKQVMEKLKGCNNVVTIFLVPPSLEELENRIRNRKTETDDIIKERLNKARAEMEEKIHYDYVVCNDDIKRASNEIIQIVKNKIKEVNS